MVPRLTLGKRGTSCLNKFCSIFCLYFLHCTLIVFLKDLFKKSTHYIEKSQKTTIIATLKVCKLTGCYYHDCYIHVSATLKIYFGSSVEYPHLSASTFLSKMYLYPCQRRGILVWRCPSILPSILKVRKVAKIRNQYNQVPHLIQDTIRESDKNTIKHHKRDPRGHPFPSR